MSKCYKSWIKCQKQSFVTLFSANFYINFTFFLHLENFLKNWHSLILSEILSILSFLYNLYYSSIIFLALKKCLSDFQTFFRKSFNSSPASIFDIFWNSFENRKTFEESVSLKIQKFSNQGGGGSKFCNFFNISYCCITSPSKNKNIIM